MAQDRIAFNSDPDLIAVSENRVARSCVNYRVAVLEYGGAGLSKKTAVLDWASLPNVMRQLGRANSHSFQWLLHLAVSAVRGG